MNRTRPIKKQVWLSREEAWELHTKSMKVGMTEADLLRNLIKGFEPKEKPPEEFYELIKQMRKIGTNLNQIAHKANAIGYIDRDSYLTEAKRWDELITQIREEYLLSKRI